MPLQHAAEDQAGAGDGGVERIADQVAEIIGAQPVGAGDIAGMDHHEGVELFGRRPQRLKTRIVEILAADVGADHGAVQAELAHGAAQFVGRLVGRLHRQSGDAGKALRVFLDVPRDLVVLDRRRRDADRRLLAIEPSLRRRGKQMHVDLGRIHVLEPPLNIMAAARKRPVRHARDLADRVVGVIRRHLQPEARDFLLHELDGGVSQHVRVHVDGFGHRFSPDGGLLCA